MDEIKELYAFLVPAPGRLRPAEDQILCVPVGLAAVPLVFDDLELAYSHLPGLREMARTMGKPIVLARFSQRQDVTTIPPEPPANFPP